MNFSSFKKKPLSVFNSQTIHKSNLSKSTNYGNIKQVRFNDTNEQNTRKQIDNTQNIIKIQSNTKSNDITSLSTISSPYEDLKKSAQKLMMNQFAEAEELSMIVILFLFYFFIYIFLLYYYF